MRVAICCLALVSIGLLTSVALSGTPKKKQAATIPNEAIDYRGFLSLATEVADYREQRRVTEKQFLDMSQQEGTLVLDTRSAAKFADLHIEGAVHLNFSDITRQSLAEAIPDKETRILIYCNNNFQNRPVNFAAKRAPAALNIPTFITLYEYGYRNLYELGPIIDADKTLLSLVSSEEESASQQKLTWAKAAR